MELVVVFGCSYFSSGSVDDSEVRKKDDLALEEYHTELEELERR